jgi:hypothetical protein
MLGDGVTSNAANPTHTYTTAGVYQATLYVQDKYKHSGKYYANIAVIAIIANSSITVYANAVAPTVMIATPSNHNSLGLYDPGAVLPFSATVTDNNPTGITYKWEIQIIHLNHIHTGQAYYTTPTFNMDVAAVIIISNVLPISIRKVLNHTQESVYAIG